MKIRVIVLLVTITIFAGLTVWQRGNVSRMLENVRRDWPIPNDNEDTEKDYDERDFDEVELDIEASERDPEAADMLRLFFSSRKLDDAARMVVKYPNNLFFRFHFANSLLNDKGQAFDLSASELAALSLLKSDPDNAHYHYFYTAILNQSNRYPDDRILGALEKANNLTKIKLSYEPYKMRLDAIKGDRNWEMSFDATENRFYRSISDLLKAYDQSENVVEIHPFHERTVDAILKMGEQLVFARRSFIQMFIGQSIRRNVLFQKWCQTEPSEIAKNEIRYEASQSYAIYRKLIDATDEEFILFRNVSLLGEGTAMLIVSGGVIVLLWLLVYFTGLIRGREKNCKIKIWHYLLLPILYFGYLALLLHLNWEGDHWLDFDYDAKEQGDMFLYLICIPLTLWVLPGVLGIFGTWMIQKKIVITWGISILICFIIWFLSIIIEIIYYLGTQEEELSVLFFLSTFLLIFLNPIFYLLGKTIRFWPKFLCLYRNRILQILMIISFLAGLHQAWRVKMRDPYVAWYAWEINAGYDIYVASFFMIVIVAVLITYSAPKGASALIGLTRVFSKGEGIAISRTRILWILAPLIFSVWGLLLLSSYALAQEKYKLETKQFDPMKDLQDLPEATKETYEAEKERLDWCYWPQEDLDTYLSKLKASREDIQYDLCRHISHCPKSHYELYLRHLEDPNTFDNMMLRAESGDVTCKGTLKGWYKQVVDYIVTADPNRPYPLDEVWEDSGYEILNYGQKTYNGETYGYGFSPAEGPPAIRFGYDDVLNLIDGLGYISSSEETEDKLNAFIELVDWDNVREEDLYFSEEFYPCLIHMEAPAASVLLKRYLEKIEYRDLWDHNQLDTLIPILENYGNKELAEKVLSLIAEHPVFVPEYEGGSILEYGEPKDFTVKACKSIAHYFDIDSISYLRKYLVSDNKVIRAFVVSQLNRLDYAWEKNELEQLRNDPNWVVRLNLLFSGNEEVIQMGLKDENVTVRVIARMMNDSTL